MPSVELKEFSEKIEALKKSLGINDAEIEAARNKGGRRTPEKIELLKRMRQRALNAGLDPIKANF